MDATVNTIFNAVGLFGTGLMLLAYALQQYGRVASTDATYLWMNLTGSVALLASLTHNWNLASFILECAWTALSLYGIVKYTRKSPS